MGSQLLAGAAVSLVNFAIHAIVTALVVVATRHTAHATSESGMFVRLAALLTITMVALMTAHVFEISVWAGYYDLTDLKLNKTGYFEFAFENYTALGYGDALPVDGDEAEKLGRMLGYTHRPQQSLRDDYRRVTRRARAVVEEIFYARST